MSLWNYLDCLYWDKRRAFYCVVFTHPDCLKWGTAKAGKNAVWSSVAFRNERDVQASGWGAGRQKADMPDLCSLSDLGLSTPMALSRPRYIGDDVRKSGLIGDPDHGKLLSSLISMDNVYPSAPNSGLLFPTHLLDQPPVCVVGFSLGWTLPAPVPSLPV